MTMDFHKHLARLRKDKGFTQEHLAKTAGINLSQIKRYETGASLPAFEPLRRLAVALRVSADLLLFGKDEHEPDDEMRLLFEAVARFDKGSKRVAKTLFEALVLQQQAKRETPGKTLAPS